MLDNGQVESSREGCLGSRLGAGPRPRQDSWVYDSGLAPLPTTLVTTRDSRRQGGAADVLKGGMVCIFPPLWSGVPLLPLCLQLLLLSGTRAVDRQYAQGIRMWSCIQSYGLGLWDGARVCAFPGGTVGGRLSQTWGDPKPTKQKRLFPQGGPRA